MSAKSPAKYDEFRQLAERRQEDAMRPFKVHCGSKM